MVGILSYFPAPSTPADGQSFLNVLVNTINAIQNSGGGTQSTQTQNIINGVIAGTQTQTSGTLSFVNSNGVSFGLSNGSQITASVAGVAGLSGGVSNVGNTLGTTGTVQSQILFAGGNNITLSQSINGQSATMTISAANQTNQTQNIVIPSAGTQTATSGTVLFSNSNGISFGMSNSSVITASYTVPTQSTQTLGLYAVSNTTLSTSGTANATNLSFAGAGNISVGISNGSVVISGSAAGGGSASRAIFPQNGFYGMSTMSLGRGTMSIQYCPCLANLSVSRVEFPVSFVLNAAATFTNNLSISQWLGIYTNNAGTLSSLSTGSTAISTSYVQSQSTLILGDKLLSCPFTANMTPGDYFFMANISFLFGSNNGGGNTNNVTAVIIEPYTQLNTNFNDDFAPLWSATNGTQGMLFGAGIYQTSSNAAPATINLTGVSLGTSIGILPVIQMKG